PMAIYNAYADRVPVFVMAGNWRDAGSRANGVNSYHSAQDMALIVRDYVKWDDEPASLAAFAESAVRAYKISMTPPMEPVLLVLDHDLQMRALGDNAPRIPRLTIPAPPAGEPGAVREAARLLIAAENPRINAGRVARTPNGIKLLVELAEALQAAVNGGGDRVNFPSRHPLAGTGSGAADAEATLPLLIEEIRRQLTTDRRRALEHRGTRLAEAHHQARVRAMEAAAYGWDSSPISLARLTAEVWEQIKNDDWSLVSWQGF